MLDDQKQAVEFDIQAEEDYLPGPRQDVGH